MSEIISIDIDENFPIAGQDNDSQGFRDNFSIVKNSLATAKSEISELEEITAKKDRDNDFNNNQIQRATFTQATEKVVSQAADVSMTLHWTYGSYQNMWWLSVALGVTAFLLTITVKEEPFSVNSEVKLPS